eukprot:TRINITY_DN5576_c0_g1_i1.p1 TRINITY_DN5576_c0_g1~~TRINITY_DN5576_c0_g1_i1.p1  ORF type:complete len:492 (-),score=89.37 TRINITY_DN5576_c0_g1_i1:7-1482(-)
MNRLLFYSRKYGVAKRKFSSKAHRDSKFSKLTQEHIDRFKKIVGTSGIVTDRHELTQFNTDWMGKYKGNSSLALKPITTQQVSEILSYCNSQRLAVVPQGGNTGLVGGSVPVFDEIVLSMQRMNKIISFDKISGVLVCQSGVILQNIEQYLSEQQYTVPLDLGAKGSCHIGGNVSTNAGGIRFLRYGSLHGSVLGLEAVLPDGRIMENLNTLKKDNTGYDMKHLFIGSEGTLGVITAVAIACPAKPKSVNVTVVGCNSFKNTQKVLLLARQNLGEILSAFEFFDAKVLELLLEKDPNARDPLGAKCPFYILIETHGSNNTHDKEKINNFLEMILNEGIVEDGTIAQDDTQVKSLWYLRENFTEAIKRTGYTYKYDVSLPSDYFYDLVDQMKDRLDPSEATVVGYGHMGDGNLHLNVITKEKSDAILNKIEPFVYEYCAKHRGSISAEHGIGFMKANELHFSKSKVMIDMMRTLKKSFDPNGILNPYKVLPE